MLFTMRLLRALRFPHLACLWLPRIDMLSNQADLEMQGWEERLCLALAGLVLEEKEEEEGKLCCSSSCRRVEAQGSSALALQQQGEHCFPAGKL